MPRELHRKVHSICPNGAANWADCDRVADARYQDWQAMQQVLLAWMLLSAPRDETKIKRLKREGQMGTLLRFMDGDAPDILDSEGNAAMSPWAQRLRAAVSRAREHDIPNYNLYGLRRSKP